MPKVVKKRNWGFVVYPESAPANWRELLRATGLQCAISPIHDKDLNPDGTPKKAHYHVIAVFNGPTSYGVVKALTDKLKQPIPQALESVRGNYRYFTHKDNPEKYQYDEKEITTINGFSIFDFVELTRSEVNAIKKRLQELIRKLQICEYADLMDLLQDNAMDAEYDVASSHTYFFDKYITSRRNSYMRTSKHENSTKFRSTEDHEIYCPECGSDEITKKGRTQAGSQRWRCKACGKRFA